MCFARYPRKILHNLHRCARNYRASQNVVPRLCSCCGGAIDSIILVFTQLHRSGLNVEFETLYDSI